MFWSSLGRYRLFMTAGTWGTWYDEILADKVRSMPIRLPSRRDATVERIVSTVDMIRAWNPASRLAGLDGRPEEPPPPSVMSELNEAVFDLFDLSAPQRELVQDFEQCSLDMVNSGSASAALLGTTSATGLPQGTLSDLLPQHEMSHAIEGYLRAFLELWNRELEPSGEFRWRVLHSPDATMVTVLFTTQERGGPLPPTSPADEAEWAEILARCAEALRQPISQRVFIDGMVRAVTDTDVIIIKRDERRLWTRSAAREDAEATLVQAMQLQAAASGR
jgi:hypothetical protein